MDKNFSKRIEQLQKKYESIGQNLETHLDGLYYSKPMTYWDYVQTDALLNLQVQRTQLPDEMVFILYHQINELFFKMILWEIKQIAHEPKITTQFFKTRLMRISRYFDMLSESFNIMGDGMELEQYLKFRDTLTPASGFQSVQYRMIEFHSTEIINLIDYRFRATIDRNTPYEYAFEHLYWQAAGKDHKTGKKSFLLTQFEDKYKAMLLRVMEEYNTINLWSKFKTLPQKDQEDNNLINAMRHYDHTVNVRWVMAHYNAANKYIGKNIEGEVIEATGGSDWRKYMHPKYQKRIFFPKLWSSKEFKNWGVNNLKT
jgi:tryptophan 2,3-dioxygenase